MTVRQRWADSGRDNHHLRDPCTSATQAPGPEEWYGRPKTDLAISQCQSEGIGEAFVNGAARSLVPKE